MKSIPIFNLPLPLEEIEFIVAMNSVNVVC
jgi:hypothetical protein